MKKFILSISLSALCAAGAFAQADTPADGVYFLYNVDHEQFLVRNGAWGTQAILDVYAQPVTIETAAGVSTLNFLDQSTVEGWTLYIDGQGGVYTDRDYDNAWSVEAVDNGFAIKSNKNNSYLTIVSDDVNYPMATATKDAAATWQFWTGEQYKAFVEAQRLSQLNAVIAKAGYNTALTDEASIFTEFPTIVDLSAEVALPTERGELYQPANDNNNKRTNYLEPLSFAFAAPQPGLYRIEVPAMYRLANNGVAAKAAECEADFFNTRIFTPDFTGLVYGSADGMTTYNFNANSSSATIKGTEYFWPNGQDGFEAWVKEGQYLNPVYVYAEAAGQEISIKVQIRCGRVWNQQWFVHNAPLTKVYLLSKKAEADLTEYNAAVEAFSSLLGFNKDQCAPYNNVEACNLYDEAVAADVFFDQNLADQYAVALRQAANEMVKNDKDLNAVYNGDFRLCQADAAMTGWASTTHELGNANGAYHSRAFVYSEGDNYETLAALQPEAGLRACAYLRFDGQQSTQTTRYAYGNAATAYSMPLNADTEYALSLDYSAWNITPRDTRFFVTDAAGKTVANKISVPEDIVKGGKATHLEIKFTPSVDGNCVLTAQNPGASDTEAFNNCIVVTNISIAKAVAQADDPNKGGIQVNPADQDNVNAPAVYYNLQGIRVDNPQNGNIYIKVNDGKAQKVVR